MLGLLLQVAYRYGL